MPSENAVKLSLFKPQKDIFDRVRPKDIFDRVELSPEDKVLASPDLRRMIADEVAKAVAQIRIPQPQHSMETIREVRVEVPAKDTRDLIERKDFDALKKENEELRKELKETRGIAERPIIVPGGSGVIGIPPPEAATVGDVLTVDTDKKHKWKPPTGGGGGTSISGYTINNGSTLKTIDVADASLDEILQLVGTLITELQA